MNASVLLTQKNHIEFKIPEKIADEKGLVFEIPFKTDLFGCVLFKDVSAGKHNSMKLSR